jgi:MFS family permease
VLTPEEQARGRRLIVASTCVSSAPIQIFQGSVLLLFLTSLSMDRVGIMICLSLPTLLPAVFQVPFAYWADRSGKKKLGYVGIVLMALSFLGLLAAACAAAYASKGAGRGIAVSCVLVYAVGYCLQCSGWMALIMPMIPEPMRPTFFGWLRTCYQSVTVLIGLVCSALLEWRSTAGVFDGLFAFFFVAFAAWLILFSRLPEVEKPNPSCPSLGVVLGKVIRFRAYLPFCAYAFLLSLFTGGSPILFGMIEKTFLDLSDGTVALLANLRLLGSIAGFYLGGKIVGRLGTKPMFLSCHFGFGLILFLFLWRNASGGPLVPILAVLEGLFGMVWAASSVAFTVEMYALIPPENKSLSTSVFMTLQGAGISLGAMLPAWAIRLGMFRERWDMAGVVRSDYDALLLICAALVVVVTVTLGLVPSVTGQTQWPSEK